MRFPRAAKQLPVDGGVEVGDLITTTQKMNGMAFTSICPEWYIWLMWINNWVLTNVADLNVIHWEPKYWPKLYFMPQVAAKVIYSRRSIFGECTYFCCRFKSDLYVSDMLENHPGMPQHI